MLTLVLTLNLILNVIIIMTTKYDNILIFFPILLYTGLMLSVITIISPSTIFGFLSFVGLMVMVYGINLLSNDSK